MMDTRIHAYQECPKCQKLIRLIGVHYKAPMHAFWIHADSGLFACR